MRNLQTLWIEVLKIVEVQKTQSIYVALITGEFTEEEGEAIFKDALDDDTDYLNTLEFVNSRLKYHRNNNN